MEPGNPEGRRDILPPETRRAIGLINVVFQSFEEDWQQTAEKLPPDIFKQWRHDNEVACLAFMLGVKPAVLTEKLKDIETIQKYLDESGKNAFIYRDTMIVDRNLVMQRITEEPEFAQELGWHDDLSIEEWLAEASPGGDGRQRAIIGFFLGYPRTAVTAYSNGQIYKPQGVDIRGPWGGRAFYFTTDAELAEAEDVKNLAEKTKTTFEKAGLGKFMQETVDV